MKGRIKDALGVIGFCLLLMIGFPTEAGERVCGFNEDELSLIKHAHKLAKPYDLSKAAIGVLIIETHAGRYGPIGDHSNGIGRRSYGPAQIKLDTARDILNRSPRFIDSFKHDYELITALIERPYWNVALMVEHLAWLYHVQNLSWRETLLAYNRGLNGSRVKDANTHRYVEQIADMLNDGKISCLYDEVFDQ